MKNLTLLFLLTGLSVMLSWPQLTANGFDLEVAISTPNPDPAIYTDVPVTITATNTGTKPGTGIKIRVGICGTDAFSFVQQNKLVYAKTGSANVGYWDWINQRWSIPKLAPGQTATLTFTLFTLTTDTRHIQVFTQSAETQDVDSAPGNLPVGNGLWVCTDQEDDEAVLSLNGSLAVPLPDLVGNLQEFIPGQNFCYANAGESVGFLSIQINNTGEVPSTDFKVKFYISTDDMLSGDDVLWSTEVVPSLGLLSVTGPAFIGPGQVIPAFLANGNYFILVTVDEENEVAELNENNNNVVPIQLQIGAPDIQLVQYTGVPATMTAGSNFTVTAQIKLDRNDIVFAGNLTYYLRVDMLGNPPWVTVGAAEFPITDFNTSDQVSQTIPVSIPATLAPGVYELKVFVGLHTCEALGVDNFQSQTVTVTTGTVNQIDLELSLAQANSTPVIYSVYEVVATLSNTGSVAATGVKVHFPKPPGVVYTGGNEYQASQGTFKPHGSEVWNVGSIPAGGTAILRVHYFLLQNGAPGAYAQVVAANEPDVDSTPNNGTPPAVNEDDEAATGSSPPPVLLPDLTLSNLTINNAPIQPGQVLTYNFTIANLGNGPAPDDFQVKAWISTDPYFSHSDIQDGMVPTGNFPAGFSVTGVPGATTLPSVLATGQYYLLLQVDAEESIMESNENNNWLAGTFLVQSPLQPGECDELIGGGSLVCTTNSPTDRLEVFYQTNADVYKATLDEAGLVAAIDFQGQLPPATSFSIEGNELVKRINNTEIYRRTIPAALFNQYERFTEFTEFQGGYLLFAWENLTPPLFPLAVIKTDLNFNVIQTNTIGLTGSSYPPTIRPPLQVSPNEAAFISITNPGIPGTAKAELIVLADDLTVSASEVLADNVFYVSANLRPNYCGSFSLDVQLTLSFCVHGSCYHKENRDGHFANGVFVTDHSYQISEFSAYGSGNRTYTWKLRTNDGGQITGTMAQQLFGYPNPPNNVIQLKKTLSGTVVWEKEVTVASADRVRRLGMSAGELVFLSEKNNAVFAEALSCLENIPPSGCGSIGILPGQGEVTITGAVAPHVLIKVFRPDWTVAFECLDSCTDPLTVSGLSTGTHFIQVKLLDAAWGEICYLEQTIEVSNLGNEGGPALRFQNERQRLAFDKVYPNPAQYFVNLVIYSKDEQPALLDFYNQQGQAIHRLDVELKKGKNEVLLDVSQWKSGTYNIIGRGNGHPAYGRLLKVWEE